MGRPPGSDLQNFMERLADGDREALSPAFEVLWPLVRRFTDRHLPAGTSEDIAQEAILKILFRASEFDRSRSALAWVLGVTAFEIRTAKRRAFRRRETSEMSSLESSRDPQPTPEEAAIESEMQALIREALGALRAEDAQTLHLYSQGRRAAVAAATFRKRVQRAMNRLRSVWRVTNV